VRILVDGQGVAVHPRLSAASIGLALRGHQVHWLGAGAEPACQAAPTIVPIADARRAPGTDLVVGAGRPLGPVHRGWFAGARCLVAGLDAASAHGWSWLDRWAWSSLASFALVEPAAADALRHRPGPLSLDRVGLWSDGTPAATPVPEHPDCEILERACERIAARQRSSAPRPAVFLDRDGTLIHEVGYLSEARDVKLLAGVPAALARLKGAGYALVVISNQAGVGRGYFTLGAVHAAMAELRRQLRGSGVELDAIYFCPHAPDAGCACRKPGTELLERAADDLAIQLRGSAMVGDKRIDVETGRRAGCRTVLVGTGYGGAEAGEPGAQEMPPDHVAADLEEAAAWLVAEAEGTAVSG